MKSTERSLRATRQPRPKTARGFTLLELLVVMVIVGLLAGLVGPRIFGKLDTTKVQTAQTQIKMLESAVNMYRIDVGGLPQKSDKLDFLVSAPSEPGGPGKWNGPYIEGKVPNDPWEKPYNYVFGDKNGRAFTITSYGADGQPGGEGLNADVTSDK